jgi:phage/plasmid-like protein (TIGR03299 family)
VYSARGDYRNLETEKDMGHEIHETDAVGIVGSKGWHGLGRVIVPGMGAEEAFRELGIDWGTTLEPLYLRRDPNPLDEGLEAVPGHFAHVRDDTGEVLGVVSDGYKPFENMDLAKMADSMAGADAAVRTETAGTLHGGRRVFACVRLPADVIAAHPEDISQSYVLISNGHGGTASLNAYLTSVRVVCMNTLRMSERDLSRGTRFRHTGDFESKVKAAREALGLAYQENERFQEAVSAMAAMQLSSADLASFLQLALVDIYGHMSDDMEPESKEKLLAKRKAMADQVLENHERDVARGTVWGALNAVTEWNDHQRSRAGARTDARLHSNLFGASNVSKGKALRRALELVR